METLQSDMLEFVVSFLDNVAIAHLRLSGKLFTGCRETRVTKKRRLQASLTTHLGSRNYFVEGCSLLCHQGQTSYHFLIPVHKSRISSYRICITISANKVRHVISRSRYIGPIWMHWVARCEEDVPTTWDVTTVNNYTLLPLHHRWIS